MTDFFVHDVANDNVCIGGRRAIDDRQPLKLGIQGTDDAEARVKNEKEELWPGQFVSGRIVLRVEDDAVTIPESAIQPGQEGPFVYVVKEGRARLQYVTVDRQIGREVVVSKGLSGDEQLVIEVPPTLTNGSQVTLGGGANAPGGTSNRSFGSA